MGAGGVLGRVQLRCLHVQGGAAPEHGAGGHGIFGREIKHFLSFAKPQLCPKCQKERVSQVPGIIMKDPWGSMATKQALRMLGESAAEIPHILHMSFSLLLSDCRFRRLSKQLQSGEANLISEWMDTFDMTEKLQLQIKL